MIFYNGEADECGGVSLHFIWRDWLRITSQAAPYGRVHLLSRGTVTSRNDTKCAVNLAVNGETQLCK